MAADYERVLAVKQEVLVYRLPPRPSNRGYRAADWGLDKPSWTGRLRIVALGSKLTIKLEDKMSGDLFAKSIVDAYPGVAIESVLDSSRYFVLKIIDDSGKSAFIGIGFADRGDSFDFNVALQDHFNSLKKDKEIESSMMNEKPLNLQLQEGQTLKISLGGAGKIGSTSKTQGAARSRTSAPAVVGGILLPPPPGGTAKLTNPTVKPQVKGQNQQAPQQNSSGQTDWGAFSSSATAGSTDPGWVQF